MKAISFSIFRFKINLVIIKVDCKLSTRSHTCTTIHSSRAEAGARNRKNLRILRTAPGRVETKDDCRCSIRTGRISRSRKIRAMTNGWTIKQISLPRLTNVAMTISTEEVRKVPEVTNLSRLIRALMMQSRNVHRAGLRATTGIVTSTMTTIIWTRTTGWQLELEPCMVSAGGRSGTGKNIEITAKSG